MVLVYKCSINKSDFKLLEYLRYISANMSWGNEEIKLLDIDFLKSKFEGANIGLLLLAPVVPLSNPRLAEKSTSNN